MNKTDLVKMLAYKVSESEWSKWILKLKNEAKIKEAQEKRKSFVIQKAMTRDFSNKTPMN